MLVIRTVLPQKTSLRTTSFRRRFALHNKEISYKFAPDASFFLKKPTVSCSQISLLTSLANFSAAASNCSSRQSLSLVAPTSSSRVCAHYASPRIILRVDLGQSSSLKTFLWERILSAVSVLTGMCGEFDHFSSCRGIGGLALVFLGNYSSSRGRWHRKV